MRLTRSAKTPKAERNFSRAEPDAVSCAPNCATILNDSPRVRAAPIMPRPSTNQPREAKPLTPPASSHVSERFYVVNRYGQIENFPPNVLGEQRDLALLFKNLSTLRTDAPLFDNSDTLRWRGATPAFAKWVKQMEAPRLLERCEKAAIERGHS